jgi:tetratricopeptide (TPR) repeat protein
LNPGHTAAWYNQGLALAELNQNQEAVDCFNHVLKIDPTIAEAKYSRDLLLDRL